MRLTALQLPARFGAIEQQLTFAEELLASGPKTDLILVNEAAFTGYVSPKGHFDLAPFAEPLDGQASRALAHFARRFDALVVGPVIEKHGTQCFNSLVAIAPDGKRLMHYRKRHPWMPEIWASPGDTPFPLFDWRGSTFTAAICFDVHFLAEEAAEQFTEADHFLFASAWVDEEGDARPGHLMPLAERFGVNVLNANWGVGKPKIRGQGGSLFIDRNAKLTRLLDDGAARLDVTASS
ncbi:MAG: carbon-nitrogen hydrolase family protein [Archangium sp.]